MSTWVCLFRIAGRWTQSSHHRFMPNHPLQEDAWVKWGRILATAALATTVGSTAIYASSTPPRRDFDILQDNEEEEGKERFFSAGNIYNRKERSNPFLFRTDTVQCEGGVSALLFSRSSPAPSRGTLNRQATLQLMEETSAEETLDQKYIVRRSNPIGQGSFGSVFWGKHRASKEKVAVKQISKTLTNDTAFQREMQAMIHIQQHGGHPNICLLQEHFEEGDYYYLVLDLVQGGEMFEHLAQKGAYSEADAARFIREIASALAFLHGIGIVHSDLKPENIMLSSKNTSDAVVKVVDFGCSHLDSNSAQDDHRHSSTPAYCPPEVLLEKRESRKRQRNVHIEPSFDMWALGVIVYIMLTGRHPFDTEGHSTVRQLEQRIVTGEMLSIRDSEYTAHLSEDAKAVIESLMERNPKKRISADKLLENSWVRGETASTKKMVDSDTRLETYRKHRTQVGTTFFKGMLEHCDLVHHQTSNGKDTAGRRTSLLESTFRLLDSEKNGYVSTKQMRGDKSFFGEDARLSFSEISDLLSENMINQYFPRSYTVYQEGQTGDTMYFVSSGTLLATDREGYQRKLTAGQFFGEDALLDPSKKRTQSVVCETPVHLLEISREYFDKYMATDEEVKLSMEENDRHRKRGRAKTILGLQKNMVSKEYKEGDVIFQEGDDGSELYILESGDVDLSVNGHKVRSLRLGEMTGEHAAYYAHKGYNVTARCVTKGGGSCKMQTLTNKDLHRLFDASPSLRDNFRDIIFRRDFKKALVKMINEPFPETEQGLYKAFKLVDTENKGALGYEELRNLMQNFDPLYTEEDIRHILKSHDLKKSGDLSWDEFRRIFGMDKES